MSISIVIQAFNRAALLEKTLIGLCHQDLKHGHRFEVIVVDNDSTVDLKAIVDKYTNRLDLLYVPRRQLANPFAIASGRNMGIRMAKYKTILIMDSDIFLPNTLMSRLIKKVESLSIPFLITAKREFVDTNTIAADRLLVNKHLYRTFPKILSESNYFKKEDNRFSHGNILQNFATGNHPWAYFYGMFTCFPKSAALYIDGYDESYDGHWGYEDIDFAYRFWREFESAVIALEGDVVYHQEPDRQKESAAVKNDRLNKAENPNWRKICRDIPGFKQWKSDYYSKLAGDIINV